MGTAEATLEQYLCLMYVNDIYYFGAIFVANVC